jgi:hypothetical protein
MRRLLLVALLSSAVMLGLGGTALAESDMCDGLDCYAPTQCSDGQDNDSNGLVDLADPGCEGNPGDQSECCYVPPPPEPPPPPPPPPSPPPFPGLVPGSWEWLEESWTCGVTRQEPVQDPGLCDFMQLVRCKRQNFRHRWVDVFGLHAVTYQGHFQVCYRHGNGIVTVLSRAGDATDTGYPWQWKGNASGYPKHYRFAHYVEFDFRGQLDFCPANWGCIHTSWPWIKITFWDVNVMAKETGVA